MISPYNNYKNTEEWHLIENAIQDLINNQDIQLTTHRDHIIGYITKVIIERNNKKIGNADSENQANSPS